MSDSNDDTEDKSKAEVIHPNLPTQVQVTQQNNTVMSFTAQFSHIIGVFDENKELFSNYAKQGS